MSLNLSQCLLFIMPEADEGGCSGRLRNSSAKRLRSSSRGTASSATKGYALFSQAFKEIRPEVLEQFKQNGVQVLANQNMSSLLRGSKKLDVFELLIDESPSVSWDRVWCVADTPNGTNGEVIRLLFPSASIWNEDRHYVTNARPAIDDVNLQIMRYLLTHKADIRCHHKNESLLHLAAKRGPASFVSLVLEHEANIEIRRNDGATPLLLAAADGRASIVKLLLERGANLQAKTNDGKNSLHMAAKSGSAPLVESLIRSGIPVDSKDRFGYTALYIAASTGHVDAAESILQYGADLNSESQDERMTIIITAALNGHTELVKMLVTYGFQVGVRTKYNRSVLSGTRDAKSPDVFQYLLENYFLDLESLKETFIIEEFRHFIDRLKSYYYYRRTTGYVNFKARLQILARHIVKITALALHPVIDEVDVTPLWSEFMSTTLSDYKRQCREEVSRLKTETVGDSSLSFHDILREDANKIAGYLRNDSIARIAAGDELEERFPIYGSILMHHFQKGKEKKVMMEEGIKICEVLFSHFKELPDEIGVIILSHLSTKELLILKKACGHLIKSQA